MLKKIVIIGPESTGKTTLCQQLSDYYKTSWVKEYAREYLLNNGRKYSYENLLDIAKGQINGEELIMQSLNGAEEDLVFIDTDMYVMKVWCEFEIGRASCRERV